MVEPSTLADDVVVECLEPPGLPDRVERATDAVLAAPAHGLPDGLVIEERHNLRGQPLNIALRQKEPGLAVGDRLGDTSGV